MNKKLQFKSLLLVVALLLGGVSSAWAAEKTNEVALGNGTFETDHITWTVGKAITIQQLQGTSTNAVNSNYISAPRLYKGHILSFTAASGYTIKKISITYSGNYTGNSMTAGTVVSEDKVTDNTTDVNRTWATESGGTHVVSSASASGLSQIYIQNVASAANTQLRPTTISITYIAPEGEKETATVKINSSTVFEKKTTTVTTDGPAVTLSTSDASTATVSGTTITGVKAGSVDITATWPEGTVGGKTYASGSQTFNVTVEANNAVTIDEQGNFIFDFTKNYWSLPTDYTQDEISYTSPDYTIKLKGTETEGEGYKFGGSYLIFGKKDASITLPAFSFSVDKIEVVGNSGASDKTQQNIFVGETAVSEETTGAKGTNIYEIASEYQAAGNIYTIKITSAHNSQITLIKVYKKGAAQEATVNIDLLKITVGKSATVTTDGPAVTLSTSDANVASVSGTTVTGVAKGTATITARWSAGKVGGVDYLAGSKEFEISVLELQDGIFDFSMGYDYGSTLVPAGTTASDITTNPSTWTSGNVTMEVSGRNVWWANDNTFRLYANSAAEGEPSNAGKLTFTAPSGNVIYKIMGLSGILTPSEGTAGPTWQGTPAQTVSFTHNGGGTVKLSKVSVFYTTPTVSVTTTGEYTTFCSYPQLDFSGTDITVYTAKVDKEKGVVNLTPVEGNIVPANKGVILKGSAKTIEVPLAANSPAISENDLIGVTTEKDIVYHIDESTKFNYILQQGAFYMATGAKLKAGKAYLSTTYDVTANSTTGARELKIVVDGEATGIKAIETVNDQNVYDLQGRKVAAPSKGLYIINGKKMIVK